MSPIDNTAVRLTQIAPDGEMHEDDYEIGASPVTVNSIRERFRTEFARGEHGQPVTELGNEKWLRFFAVLRDSRIPVTKLTRACARPDIKIVYSHIQPAAV